SFTKVPVHTYQEITMDIQIIPRKPLEHTKHIAVGNTIISLEKGKGYTYIATLTKGTITLSKNIQLGTYEKLNESDIKCNLDELNQTIISTLQTSDEQLPTDKVDTIDDGN